MLVGNPGAYQELWDVFWGSNANTVAAPAPAALAFSIFGRIKDVDAATFVQFCGRAVCYDTPLWVFVGSQTAQADQFPNLRMYWRLANEIPARQARIQPQGERGIPRASGDRTCYIGATIMRAVQFFAPM
ncbi:hypothetical protein BDZ88DRAFT_448412 [Geranomyces variabilis]|nr:hypothetical protein BDZ88DRAFT_448412 [Geranomyces variabilis]KAJ3143428.1 hypothetical protein HDU90_000188 [Geranomyces variabilis]